MQNKDKDKRLSIQECPKCGSRSVFMLLEVTRTKQSYQNQCLLCNHIWCTVTENFWHDVEEDGYGSGGFRQATNILKWWFSGIKHWKKGCSQDEI